MRRQYRNLLTLGAIGLAISLFVILGVVQTQKSSKASVISEDSAAIGQELPPIGGAFQLVDKDGETWQDTDFKGKPMLIYFGYTYCPDICPMALYHMTQAMEDLGGAKVIQPIFITIDPHRDTVDLLQIYAQNFHKDFIMLTGSKDQVDQAIKAYRVYAARTSEDQNDTDYLMDHSSLIYFMDKQGRYRAHFNHQTSHQEIVQRVKLYLEKGE